MNPIKRSLHRLSRNHRVFFPWFLYLLCFLLKLDTDSFELWFYLFMYLPWFFFVFHIMLPDSTRLLSPWIWPLSVSPNPPPMKNKIYGKKERKGKSHHGSCNGTKWVMQETPFSIHLYMKVFMPRINGLVSATPRIHGLVSATPWCWALTRTLPGHPIAAILQVAGARGHLFSSSPHMADKGYVVSYHTTEPSVLSHTPLPTESALLCCLGEKENPLFWVLQKVGGRVSSLVCHK